MLSVNPTSLGRLAVRAISSAAVLAFAVFPSNPVAAGASGCPLCDGELEPGFGEWQLVVGDDDDGCRHSCAPLGILQEYSRCARCAFLLPRQGLDEFRKLATQDQELLRSLRKSAQVEPNRDAPDARAQVQWLWQASERHGDRVPVSRSRLARDRSWLERIRWDDVSAAAMAAGRDFSRVREELSKEGRIVKWRIEGAAAVRANEVPLERRLRAIAPSIEREARPALSVAFAVEARRRGELALAESLLAKLRDVDAEWRVVTEALAESISEERRWLEIATEAPRHAHALSAGELVHLLRRCNRMTEAREAAGTAIRSSTSLWEVHFAKLFVSDDAEARALGAARMVDMFTAQARDRSLWPRLGMLDEVVDDASATAIAASLRGEKRGDLLRFSRLMRLRGGLLEPEEAADICSELRSSSDVAAQKWAIEALERRAGLDSAEAIASVVTERAPGTGLLRDPLFVLIGWVPRDGELPPPLRGLPPRLEDSRLVLGADRLRLRRGDAPSTLEFLRSAERRGGLASGGGEDAVSAVSRARRMLTSGDSRVAACAHVGLEQLFGRPMDRSELFDHGWPTEPSGWERLRHIWIGALAMLEGSAR